MATQTQQIPTAISADRANNVPARRWSVGRIMVYLLILLGAGLVLIPFAWMVSTSLTLSSRLFVYPPDLIPNPIAWENYSEAWSALPVSFTRFFANTVFITVLAMV